MKLVSAKEPGKNITLHPDHKDRIYTDIDDEGNSLRIAGKEVIRVDKPSFKMQQALTREVYTDKSGNRCALLVETTESPTPPPPDPLMVIEMNINAAKRAMESQIKQESERLGFVSDGVSIEEGDSTDLASKRVITGEYKRPKAKVAD